MPDLLRRLLDQPLRPLTRARLPERDALYLFYHGEEPVLVGSPPHVDEVRTLARPCGWPRRSRRAAWGRPTYRRAPSRRRP